MSSTYTLLGLLLTRSVLVPTDSAFSEAKAANPEVFASNESTRALIEYHILKDTHPSASFSNTSQLIPTLLNNTAFTNVTGGQKVELANQNGQPTLLSAVKAESRITHGDIFYVGGLLHIVDSVLQIPLSFPATITKAKLTDLVALLNKGHWLTPDSVAYQLALNTPDLSIFGPNDPRYGADFTGWDGLSQEQLDVIFMYHVLPTVEYTPDIHNGSSLMTVANTSIIAREYKSANETATFFDQAQLTGTNYLTANGVLHIINRALDPNHPGASPSPTDISLALGGSTQTLTKKGLSTGAIVGIVIGLIAVFVTIGLVFALRWRMRKKRFMQNGIPSSSYRQMPPDYQTATRELPAEHSHRASIARLSAPLPARPRSVARSVASIRGAIWPSRPPQNNILELDAKDAAYHVTVRELDSAVTDSTGGSQGGSQRREDVTRPIKTPPELDGLERIRRHSSGHSHTSHVSITIQNHSDRPIRHIGFQAQY